MGDIVKWRGRRVGEVEADTVLIDALGLLADVLVLGYEQDGTIYLRASRNHVGGALLLLEQARRMLLDMSMEED